MRPDQVEALAELRALGQQVDAAALLGAGPAELDLLLAGMRRVHEAVAGQLGADLQVSRPAPGGVRVTGARRPTLRAVPRAA